MIRICLTLLALVLLAQVSAFAGGGGFPSFNVLVRGANYPVGPDYGSYSMSAFANEYNQPFFTAAYSEATSWTAFSLPGGKDGRWSNIYSNYLFSQIWSMEGYVWSGLQETRSQLMIEVSWGNDSGYYWSFKLQRPDGSVVDQWQTNTLGYQTKLYTLPTVKAALADWKNGYKYTIMVSDDPLPNPTSVGQVKSQANGSLVTIDRAVVTASSLTPGVSFVEASDRSAGIKVLTNQPLAVGQQVSVIGKFGRVDGEYQIDTQNPTPLSPMVVNTRTIGNDTAQTLSYTGINTTGLLLSIVGKVTKTAPADNVFYVDDGVKYSDGYGSPRIQIL